MELLKNKEELNEWRECNIFDGDTADEPKEYPCYVYKMVENWDYQDEKAVYFYRDDLKNMLFWMEET